MDFIHTTIPLRWQVSFLNFLISHGRIWTKLVVSECGFGKEKFLAITML